MNSRGGAPPPNQASYPEKPAFPSTSYAQGGVSFTFRKRWGQIDWRKLASVDVDRIAKEVDFQALQQNIMNITFCNVETEEFQHVDHNFIKIFKLSQLVIEYLLHSQQYLSNRSTSLEQKVLQVHQELDKAKNDLKAREEELKVIKKENRKRRKVIEAYQDMINAGATGIHDCPVCKREFVSSDYLQSHIQRRHPDHLPKAQCSTKQQLTPEDLESKLMEQMTQRLLSSEKVLREEMKQKEQETLSLQVKDFENWKKEEKRRMTIEIEEFKRPIITELEELRQEKKDLEKTLRDKEAELQVAQNKRQSHLGHLEGAKELFLDGTNKLNESKAEIEQLKGTLETRMQEMQTTRKEQDRSWQKKMHKLSTSYRDQLAESTSKLEALEQSIEGSKGPKKDRVSKQLKSLQQKMKQQEELLVSQQDQLTTLQSREPSPIPPSHPHKQDSGSSGSDSDDDDHDDHTDGNKCFTPMNHRPMIKTKYAHKQEDIDKIRRQTEAVFSDIIVQKGLERDSNGLKARDFEEKMFALKQERQQKIQSHFHFAEHRQRLVHDIEEIVAMDSKPALPTQKYQVPLPKQECKAAKAAGKPPKPASKHSSPSGPQHEHENISPEVVPGPLNSDRSAGGSDISITTSYSEESEKEQPPIQLKQHMTISDNPQSENTPTVVVTEIVVNKSSPPKVPEQSTAISRVDNSWDSDDSIEELDPPHNGRTSSTPKVQNEVAPNPTKGARFDDNISLDSFDLSTSDPMPTSQPSKVEPPATVGLNLQSRTVTSQSALTSVSVGDFGSDSYDLDISDLT